jgi:hypothetical protein
MKKNLVHHVRVHVAKDADMDDLAEKISAFHVEMIERTLHQSDFTTEEKIAVVNQILAQIRTGKGSGTIEWNTRPP